MTAGGAAVKFNNPKEAQEFVEHQMNAYRSCSMSLAQRQAINRCMYEGVHWLNNSYDLSQVSTTGRRYANWNPDSQKLVATINRIPKFIHECAAATFPDRIETDAVPSDRATGINAAYKAQVLESATNALISMTGYVEAARTANFRRCIDGTHGIGWSIVVKPRTISLRKGGEETVHDQVLRAFAFDSTKLTLDPHNQSLDLHEHDAPIYTDVWTIEKIRRMFGDAVKDIRDDDLQTCGELMSTEVAVNFLSQNRLYTNLPLYSKTKGAKVHDVYVKDQSGRFSTRLIGIKIPQKDMLWVNWDSPESPFGGCGMPLVLLHGYRRSDSMWSVSDAAMLKDDQDRMNLLATFFFRMMQKNAGYQWLIDESAMGANADIDDFKNQFNNFVAGVVTYKTGTRDRPGNAPQLVKNPDPPSFIQEAISMYGSEMREMVHRPDITTGSTKSHVPNQTFQTALRNANQVLGNRVREDLGRYEWHLGVGLGTLIKLAQSESPTVLGELSRAGFDEQDYAVIAQTDPYYPACEIRVRESSIKYQSKEEKEQRLWAAVDRGAVDAPTLRITLADMDIPLSENDKAFYIEANKAAMRVLLGDMWQPQDLGPYSDMFLNAFRKAKFDRIAKEDAEASNRLDAAIQMQNDYMLALAARQQQMLAPQQPAQAEPQMQDTSEPTDQDVSALLSAFESSALSRGVPA